MSGPAKCDLDDNPLVQSVWPGLKGSFTAFDHPGPQSHVLFFGKGEIEMHLAESSAALHELAHVMVLAAYPDLARNATEDAHEAAAMLVERALCQTKQQIAWWWDRMGRQPPEVRAEYQSCRPPCGPLPEVVRSILVRGQDGCENFATPVA